MTTESIKQYKKEENGENRISNITYQKARYQEYPEVQLVYKKYRYHENLVNIVKHKKQGTKKIQKIK